MMIRTLLSLLFLAGLTLFAEEPEAEQRPLILEASVGAGWARYEEQVSLVPIRSDWEAPTGTFRVQAVVTRYPVDVYGSVRWTGSATDTEQWREGRFLVQENDLTYGGVDLRFGLRFPLVENEALQIIPRVGGALKLDLFERENFFFLRDEGTLFTLDQEVTESVFTVGPSVGIRIWTQLGERFALQLDTEFFWASTSEADNDGFQIEIEGDGGMVWSGEVALFVDLIRPENQMGISVGALIQDLDGGKRILGDTQYEWPDSTLEQFYVELFWVARF